MSVLQPFLEPLGAPARLRLSGILSEAKGGDALATLTVVVLDYKNPQALNRNS
ncbi:MAG: hypothetical protein Q8R28_06100 [Dehalococcoidia bacterium]|nr:hypothetical protein [Dehalococcoidia bacterium]